jgi:hypothetical protein
MKTIDLIIPVLALALSAANAGEHQLEVRMLRTSGAVPSEKTLQSLVEDPGAQATPMISVTLPEAGDTKIRQVTSYRYATEYTPKGEPDSFVAKDLGWTGSAVVSHSGAETVNLKLDLTNLRIGAPHVYDIKGIQATMPVFTSVKIPDQELVLTRGTWRFVKGTLGEETYYWAVRITNQKS